MPESIFNELYRRVWKMKRMRGGKKKHMRDRGSVGGWVEADVTGVWGGGDLSR